MSHSRREFFTASGGLMAAGLWSADGATAAESVSPMPAPVQLPESWSTRDLTAEVLVAGGGLAGVCAALAAARNGASVILVQDRSRLGGNSSSEIRMHVCGANQTKDLALWRETGIIEELKLTESATNRQRSFEMWDLLLYDKVVSEAKVTLLLDTAVTNAEVAEGRIVRVVATSSMLAERYSIRAKHFIDCTGDAALAAAAGAKCVWGREARDQYGESLAPETADRKTMGNSLLFQARRHETPMPFQPPTWARKFTSEDFKHRAIRSWEYGYWWIEWGGELDTIKDNRRIRHELLRILMGVWDYIKNSGKHPESENWALEWVGMLPGKRENRRIVGEHILIQSEVEGAELFSDRVAYGGWPLDDHPPGGMDDRDLPPCQQIHLKQPYSIPLRSLYSADVKNLFMAGRNLSASHVALTSTRVMATCSTLGQAVGTAAAYCAQRNLLPKEVTGTPERMDELQQVLLRHDQSLLGVANADPADLARKARVTCSHQTEDGAAEQVIDGWNRDIGDGKTHQWRAAMGDGKPWLRLDWEEPQTIRQIQFTFDTALQRRLFLSGEDGAYKSQTRGPQPETIAEYAVEVLVGSVWREVARNTDNSVRRVVHEVEPVAVSALRLRVIRTQGDALARVFEVRCYG